MSYTSIYITKNGKKIIISETIISQLLCYKQDQTQNESGGILLGRIIQDTKDIIIDKVSVPMPGDKSSRFSFFRSRKKHQKIIDEEFIISKQTCNYLGEWHTHPEGDPVPSWKDLFNWRTILKKFFFDNEYLYFIIVGTEKINVWEGYKNSKKITKLDQK